jgi:hypothetical protein
MTNLYWPVYKDLENEVIKLSNQVHFDDNQLSIYSVKISELLIRCSVEIEAISKELYLSNGGIESADGDLYFDTDCINFIENKWLLSKKKVIVSSSNLFFQREENRILTPLYKANKRGESGSDWKKAYQAVKHNRSLNLTKGNIKNLLRAMAALFLLNVYYKNEKFDLADKNNENFSKDFSELFAIKVHTWRGNGVGADPYMKNPDFDECVYFVKWTDEYNKKHTLWATEHNKILNDIIFNHPGVTKYINENLVENGNIKQEEFIKFIQNRDYFKCFDMDAEYGGMVNRAMAEANKKFNFDWRKAIQFEAVLNKNQQIYTEEKNETPNA